MNREEAIESCPLSSEVMNLVNKIYDDFESRTCENCTSFHGVTICLDMRNAQWVSCDDWFHMQIDKDFSCPNFKRTRQWQD